MNKYKKLAKNTTIFFVANFGSKILTFFLVRFYTEFLSAKDYGIIDLLNTTASLAFPIITLCITEAVLRFSIDDTDNRGKILTNGLLVTTLGNILFLCFFPILSQFDIFSDNVAWLYLLTLTNSLYAIITHFSRGIGKTKLFALAGLLHTILQVGLNILFLVVFSWGITGYFISSILSNVLTGGIVFCAGRLHKFIASNIDGKYLKSMIVYALPLIPNSVFWWIMQSADRYMITYAISTTANGLYAVANKIPTLITTISGIFFQAWQLSSVEEASAKGKDGFYTRVFDALSMVLILATSAIMVVLQPVYRLLTEQSYYTGWTCVPFLLCAMVYSCYSSFLGTNYVAMKKTKGVFLTTIIGAAINIIFNFFLIPIMGIEGAALATLCAYCATWGMRIWGTRNFVTIKYPVTTFWLPSGILLSQACLLTFGIYSMWIQAILFLILFLIYIKDIVQYVKLGSQLLNRKKRKVD